MRLYAGTSKQFIEDTVQNQIAEKLKKSFHDYYGRQVSPSEYNSWGNSLQYLKNIIQENLLMDNMIVLEYEIPYSTNRVDVILFGKGENNEENVVVIELKQWSKVDDCDIEGNIRTFVGGANRMEPHPSIQVRGYHFFLKDFISVFEDEELDLYSCAYCHNYSRTDNAVLFKEKFSYILEEFPLFAKEDFNKLGSYLKERLSKGQGLNIFNQFCNSPIVPSKKLLEHTESVMKGNPAFTLIDEQLTAYNTIVDRAKKVSMLTHKSIIIVKGGPGTGKSVIALNVLAELLQRKQKVYHATGSAAFTTTLRKILGTRLANLFKYFNSFGTTPENGIDVLICDEAHRIRKTSNSRYTKAEFRTNKPQIDELLKAAKVCIFFIDDYQAVRPDEIGSTEMIKEHAKIFDAEIFEFELKTQFRCSGSDGFLQWVDNTLAIRETPNRVLTKTEKMDFKIFNSPEALLQAIKAKNKEKANSARMVAGFCWPWSDTKPDGTLVEDIVIGDFRMTWEAKNESTNLAPGVVKASLWANDPNGVSQCGSIYTAQGFEFEYIGILFGKDLVYDKEKNELVGLKENSSDSMVKKASSEEFTRFIKNVYRVLLTRGMKGCYVYFLDKDTENYFSSRIEF